MPSLLIEMGDLMDLANLPGLWNLTWPGAFLGVLVLFFILLATGRLITKSSHEREIGIYREMIANKDRTIDAQSAQITALLPVAKTFKAFLLSAGPDDVIDEDTIRTGGE